MKKRILSLVICLSLLSVAFSMAGNSEDAKTILSIGDSISTGYGLSVPETEGFAYNLGNENDILINKAINGNTADGILKQLTDDSATLPITKEDIMGADIITITCGGNDLMAVLYDKVVSAWNKANPDKLIEKANIREAISQYGVELLQFVILLLNPQSEAYLINDPGFIDKLNQYEANISTIVSHMKNINPNVEIIIATQYNPYKEFKGNALGNTVYSGVEVGVKKLNDVITQNADEIGYTVADVKKAFDSYKGKKDLYNADIKSMEVDFHHTAAGHEILKNTFNSLIIKSPVEDTSELDNSSADSVTSEDAESNASEIFSSEETSENSELASSTPNVSTEEPSSVESSNEVVIDDSTENNNQNHSIIIAISVGVLVLAGAVIAIIYKKKITH
jgi:lysophospholipase L1-like esterase